MIVVGLTGSIGMGKSTAANMFRRLGVPVFDSDAEVDRLLKYDAGARSEIAAVFPEAWSKSGLDRKALGQRIFHDLSARRRLEHILHPRVRDARLRFLAHARQSGVRVAVVDIPLLFETGSDREVDITLCVTAPPTVQRRRVLSRPNMTPQKFRAILRTQMPDSQKRYKADVVIHTGGGYGQTYRSLSRFLQKLRFYL